MVLGEMPFLSVNVGRVAQGTQAVFECKCMGWCPL